MVNMCNFTNMYQDFCHYHWTHTRARAHARTHARTHAHAAFWQQSAFSSDENSNPNSN